MTWTTAHKLTSYQWPYDVSTDERTVSTFTLTLVRISYLEGKGNIFSLVWMAVGFVPAITIHVHQYGSNNANYVSHFVYFTAIFVYSQTRLKLLRFSFTEPYHGPRKFAPILNHSNAKISPSANYSLSHFSWRWGKVTLVLVLCDSLGKRSINM